MELLPPYTGKLLQAMAESPVQPRHPLIEQLIYEKSVMMFYADPGVGKSILSLCMALQASSGADVFGFFKPVRPLKIYYALTERGIEEPLERIQMMRKKIDINYDNIFFDEGTIGINVLDMKDETMLIQRIEKYCQNPDIIVFDPIYAMVRGGLSDPEDATLFAQFSARIQNHFKCANWFNHHTLKNTNDLVNGEYVPKNDPFMGSQLLKAHVTGMYHLTQTNNKPHLSCKKDSHSVLLKQISLDFDNESYTLSVKINTSEIPCKERVTRFLNECKRTNRKFTFDQFHAAIMPSALRYTQKMLGVTIKEGLVLNVSDSFTNGLYQVL